MDPTRGPLRGAAMDSKGIVHQGWQHIGLLVESSTRINLGDGEQGQQRAIGRLMDLKQGARRAGLRRY